MYERLKNLVLCGPLIALLACSTSVAQPQAEWTILVYMNAKNNLEPAALTNFYDMAAVGSTSTVNIVVEMGRPATHRYSRADGNWTGVRRFYVKRDSRPIPNEAIEDLGPADMGDRETFRRFVSWGKNKYPARRYMVVRPARARRPGSS
jgi:hypothetical protein